MSICGVENGFPFLHDCYKIYFVAAEKNIVYLIHGCLFSDLTTLLVDTFFHGTILRIRLCAISVQFLLVGESQSLKESENQIENGVNTCCDQTEFEIRPEPARL